MQIDAIRREVSSSGVMRTAQATIKATPKIFDMFENGTYANKPLAIMRELVANGIDAQRTVNPTRPVEVVLPTPLDPTCRIRDFGIGMSETFIMGDPTTTPPTPSTFMAYTDGSTKDKSDDDIGGFGIGSKSPFAYVDQYGLRVVHEGILSIYTMYKDAEGLPAVGLQAQTTTDEPNGVEVSFPVEDADMATFAEAAQAALQYFDPLPLVTNGAINAPDYTYRGTGWALRKAGGPLGIIMGGVRYPVTSSSLDYALRTNKRLSPLLEYGIDLTLPLGACGIAMSREQLSYVPKTSTNISSALEAVIDDVVNTFSNFFDTEASEWDAMKKLSQETGGVSAHSRSARAQLLLANAKYKGEKLESSFRIEPHDFKTVGLESFDVRAWLVDPVRSRRSQNCPPPQWKTMVELYGITPDNIETVIIDDLPQSPKSKTVQRLRAYISDQLQAKHTLVVRGPDVAKLVALLRGPTDYVLTSSMPMPAAKAKAGKTDRPRVRMFTFNGNTDKYTHSTINNLTPSLSKADAVAEVPYVNQPATGIMVVMNSFDLPADFHAKMRSELIRFSELHFVNAADAPKIKATFRDFNEVFDERLAKALAVYPDLPQRIAMSNNSVMATYGATFRNIDGDRRYMDLPSAAKQRPFGRLFELWRTYVKPLTSAQRLLSPFVKAALPVGVNPQALAEAMQEKQKDVTILMRCLELDETDHRGLFFRNL